MRVLGYRIVLHRPNPTALHQTPKVGCTRISSRYEFGMYDIDGGGDAYIETNRVKLQAHAGRRAGLLGSLGEQIVASSPPSDRVRTLRGVSSGGYGGSELPRPRAHDPRVV